MQQTWVWSLRRKKWQPTPASLLGEVHGQRSHGVIRVGHDLATKPTKTFSCLIWNTWRLSESMLFRWVFFFFFREFNRTTTPTLSSTRISLTSLFSALFSNPDLNIWVATDISRHFRAFGYKLENSYIDQHYSDTKKLQTWNMAAGQNWHFSHSETHVN